MPSNLYLRFDADRNTPDITSHRVLYTNAYQHYEDIFYNVSFWQNKEILFDN